MMSAKIIATTWMIAVVRQSPASAVSLPLNTAISDIRTPAASAKK